VEYAPDIRSSHTLRLLRHAKSSWDDPTLADRERPLAPRGVRDAKRIATHLGGRGIEPELVLCSSAVRTRETLDLVRPALGDPQVLFEDGIYDASADALLGRLRSVPDSVASVLLLGHNPGVQDLTLRLAAAGARRDVVATKFPTCALATLAVPNADWRDLGDEEAELVDFVAPKQLART